MTTTIEHLQRERIGLPGPRFGVVFGLLLALATGLVAFATSTDLRVRLDLASTAIVLITLRAATADRRHRRLAFAIGVLSLLSNGSGLSGFRPFGIEIGPVASFFLVAYTTFLLIAALMRAKRVTGDVLAGALAAYIMTGLAFGMIYGVAVSYSPSAIRLASGAQASLSDLVYFSFITLMTIGYGDITPVSPGARAVAMLEGLSGITLTTIVLATLVANYLSNRANGR